MQCKKILYYDVYSVGRNNVYTVRSIPPTSPHNNDKNRAVKRDSKVLTDIRRSWYTCVYTLHGTDWEKALPFLVYTFIYGAITCILCVVSEQK